MALGLVRGLVLVAAVLALTACSGSAHAHLSSAVVRHFRGLPPGVSAQHWPPASASAYRPSAAWAGPTSIYLMTWGSSSCPHLPTSVRADRPGQLLISTAGDLYSGGMCTADLSVTTSIVRLPAGIDSSRRLAVQINKTRVTLPARVECGAWAAQDSAQARAVLATRGRLTSCELIGRTWMVTTVSAHRPGEVGLLTCSAGDQACLDGDRPHDLTAFTWISAPKKVGPGLKLYGGTGPNGPVFIYTTARHGQIKFDLARGTFTVCPHGVCQW